MLEQYIRQLTETANRGDAREESYYGALKELLERYCESVDKKGVHITVLPKKTEAGNPDFRVWDGRQHVIGYIEAKDPSIENLDGIEDSPHLKKYRDTFPNLILTNFLEFRLYRSGKTLVDLHLLQSKELSATISRFEGKGDNKVDRVGYGVITGRMFIHHQKFFEGISEDVWKFRIGSYQVCEKWLKDRRGRSLTKEQIQRYCKIVTAISKTIEVQKQVDALFDKVEKSL